MTWNPDDFTAIHNHGVTEWGAVCFFGEAVNRLYETREGKVQLSRKDVFERGKIIPMHGELTHMMGNGGKTGFLTLHIYGSGTNLNIPYIRETVFLPEHKLLTGTNGPAFLNMTEIIEGDPEFFNGYTEDTLLDYFNLIKPYYSKNKRDDLLEKISGFEKNIDTYYR
ncbi:MAG: hypothetical protein P1P83_05190 [Bacteroidales bacterium]|nr:hypothetical protein [Bacteroidales bacterium]MDT8374225.1 hypothetical protein [Bacteroidales bacterium]